MVFKKFGSYQAERPFNFAVLLLERLDILFQRCNEAAVEHTPFMWYKVLKAISRAISFKLNDEQQKELKKKLDSASGKVKNITNNSTEILYFECEKSLEELEIYIIALMYEHGLYYPKYKNKSWEESEIEETDV